MKLVDFVCIEATVVELQQGDRDGVIKELVQSLDKAGKIGNGKSDEIASEVISRENEASTGMGKGVAMPHVKHEVVKDVVAVIGQSSSGIEFMALDKEPVYSVILLVSPVSNPDKHLQAMETVFRHLQKEKFRRFLRICKDTKQIHELLVEADEDPSL